MSDNRKSFTLRDMLTSGGNGEIGCATLLGYVTATYQGGDIVCVTVDGEQFAPAQQGSVPEGRVAIPRDVAEAKGMYLVGYSWLKYNAPHELTSPSKPEQEWVRCDERLPTEAEAGCDGSVWFTDKSGDGIQMDPILMSWSYVTKGSGHWKPTGLKRPQPPKDNTQEGSGDA